MTTDAFYKDAVRRYFREKAGSYDRVDEQVYWRLSDALLWRVLQENIAQLRSGIRFLDAGGGTGRWSKRLLDFDPACSGVLFDLSEEMTAKAAAKLSRSDTDSRRLTIVHGDLDEIENHFKERSFDLIIALHNVLGFVSDPKAVVAKLANLLMPGGLLISLVPNRYHAIFFNLGVGEIHEARIAASSSRGRFTSSMPYIHTFTPASLSELYQAARLRLDFVTGFPNFIYPSVAETQGTGSTPSLVTLLQNAAEFNEVLEIEWKFLSGSDIAARGNNLFAKGIK